MTRVRGILLAICALAAGCIGGERPGKSPASALWLAAGSDALPSDQLAELARAGVSDLFMPAGDLHWNAGTASLAALAPVAIDALPRGAHVTLVIGGSLPASADPKTAAPALAAAVRQLRLQTEDRGRIADGVHLDLAPDGPPETALPVYAELLRRLRAELPRDLFLSATLARSWLADPELAEAVREFAAGVDFLVAFLYGQRSGEGEDASAWLIESTVRDVRSLEALDVPYQVGVAMVGAAAHLRAGRELARSGELGLKSLATSPALRLEHGFSLESGDRQIYNFRALNAARLGGWQLEPGDTVRVVRTGAPFLQALRKRLSEAVLARRLGEAYFRAPRPSEALTPTLASLRGALQAAPLIPDLRLRVEPADGAGGRPVSGVRVILENHNDEGSELSGLEHNYVELVAEGGTIGAVDTGEFSRYELMRAGEARHSVRALRAPDRVRLYLPVLEGRDRARSGPISVRGARRITASATFLLPDGSMVTTPVVASDRAGSQP